MGAILPGPSTLACAAVALALSIGAKATAADLSPAALSDFKRAVAAVSLSSSASPAVRDEQRMREPSPGFLLGAAYAAWTNAATQLAFDVTNPTAAGPPHASQNGALAEFLADDCREEATAFTALADQARALGVSPGQLAAAAEGDAAPVAARLTTPPSACR